ncbi:30S ribosomal protein S4 (plastid) [Lotharella oceanica]|uniref:30S ribosomal protein S4 n=1 Tax=Lotharella oceanica TaxID=641309 RepID=A0A059SLI9_9EUKA|nr:30S ribosomal protein S4 [Lotharella oceanica]
MARYSGSRIKIIRRLGLLPGFTTKVMKKSSKSSNFKRLSQYGLHLQEKQKLRYNYGVSEHELIKYVQKSRKKKGDTGYILLQLLESRLDSMVYRAGIAPTIIAARQLINHGHIFVNGNKVTIPGFYCKIGTKISMRKSILNTSLELNNNESQWFSIVDKNDEIFIVKTNEPNIQLLGFSINILLVLEYYSGK